MSGHKRFRGNPTFDSELHPMPRNLSKTMDFLGRSFFTKHSRNLEIMDTSERPLFGLMTHYDSENFFWIQPMRSMHKKASDDYHQYLKRINKDAKSDRLERFCFIHEGTNCLARYDQDGHWYRAIIIENTAMEQWQVFFIDYGNFQQCKREDLRLIVDDETHSFFHAPVQAVCCRLYNVSPRVPENRDKVDIKLNKYFLEHSEDFLEVIVKNHRPDFVVDCDVFLVRRGIVGADRLHRRHIGQELVDDGLATFIDKAAAFINKTVTPAYTIELSDDDEDEEMKPSQDIKPKTETKPQVDVKPQYNINSGDVKAKEEVKVKIEV